MLWVCASPCALNVSAGLQGAYKGTSCLGFSLGHIDQNYFEMTEKKLVTSANEYCYSEF